MTGLNQVRLWTILMIEIETAAASALGMNDE